MIAGALQRTYALHDGKRTPTTLAALRSNGGLGRIDIRSSRIVHAISEGFEHLQYLPELSFRQCYRISVVLLSQRIDDVLE